MHQDLRRIIVEGEISPLRTDSGESGITEEVNLLKYADERYVLRRSKTSKRADRYQNLSQLFEPQGFLPKLLGREGDDLVYEFIEGRDLQGKERENFIAQVGGILARVNQRPSTEPFSFVHFEKCISYIPYSDKDKKRLTDQFKELVTRNNPEICYDVSDAIPQNFRVRDNKVYLVDIDSIYEGIKGAGIGKAFFKWVVRPEKKEAFLLGYGEVVSPYFLTPIYLEMVRLNFLVTNLGIKIKHNRNSKDLPRLKEGIDQFL